MAAITIDQLTNATNATDGTGALDVMMKTITLHIDEQFKQNRIKGTEYAQVYLGAVQSVIAEANKFVLQQQAADKQAELYARQTQGFDDDARQKAAKQLLDSWSVMYSSAPQADLIPDAIKIQSLDTSIKDILDTLLINNTINPAV